AAVDLGLLPRRRSAAESLAPAAGQFAREQPPAGHARVRTAITDGPRAHARAFPQRHREPLQRALRWGLPGGVEGEQTRLRAGVEFELEGLIVLPRDAQASGLTHDAADAKGLARVARRRVGLGIPVQRRLASFRVHGNAGHIAL